ncbi:MAG: hypothetical protein ACU85U_03140 [Gammaproteobacteria bacterium]
MRNKLLIVCLLACAFSDASVFAREPVQQDATRDGETRNADAERPEFTRRSLPSDTFKPTEEISEDFPVPFPVDI